MRVFSSLLLRERRGEEWRKVRSDGVDVEWVKMTRVPKRYLVAVLEHLCSLRDAKGHCEIKKVWVVGSWRDERTKTKTKEGYRTTRSRETCLVVV